MGTAQDRSCAYYSSTSSRPGCDLSTSELWHQGCTTSGYRICYGYAWPPMSSTRVSVYAFLTSTNNVTLIQYKCEKANDKKYPPSENGPNRSEKPEVFLCPWCAPNYNTSKGGGTLRLIRCTWTYSICPRNALIFHSISSQEVTEAWIQGNAPALVYQKWVGVVKYSVLVCLSMWLQCLANDAIIVWWARLVDEQIVISQQNLLKCFWKVNVLPTISGQLPRSKRFLVTSPHFQSISLIWIGMDWKCNGMEIACMFWHVL